MTHPVEQCQYRLGVIRERQTKQGPVDVYRCAHPLNVPAAEAVHNDCGCRGAMAVCDACPFWDEAGKRWVYKKTEMKGYRPPTVEVGITGQPNFDDVKPRYVRQADMIEAAQRLAGKLPRDIAVVAGVPRSGMMPAAAIANCLSLPLAEMTKDGAFRMLSNGHRGVHHAPGKILVVDDTVYSGLQITTIRNKSTMPNLAFAAIYTTPTGAHVPDYFAEILPSPHFLEWNLFNGHMLHGNASDRNLKGGIGLDLDGLLCENPPFSTEREDEQPGEAEYWFEHLAPPTWHRPVLRSIPLVITARLERYRAATLRWLASWRMRVEDLVMHPAETARARGDSASWKAQQLRDRGVRWYVESNTDPAVRLSRTWPEGYVLDVESGRFYRKGKPA